MPRAVEAENDSVLSSDLSSGALFDVSGKVVLVSGGASGIGAMIAGGFVANGATVYICSRKDSSRWAAELTAKGPGRCVSVSADLTEQHDIDQLLEFITGAEGKLHCLVNNSGANWAEPLPDYSITGWNKVQDLNVTAVFNLTKCALPLLSAACHENDPARVINIASVDGLTTPALDTFSYSASKAAVIHMSSVLAGRLIEHGITVNSISPGAFQSRMMRATIEAVGDDVLGERSMNGRIGVPSDIAGACLFLSSRAGAWMTGCNLVLDGGSVVRPRL